MHKKIKFPFIIDGGTGTELERRGAPMNGMAWSAEAVLTHPQLLRDVHQSFLDAGAQLLIANTFSTGIHNLEAAGLADRFEDINREAVHIVREVVKKSKKECIVAGAISSTTFTGSLNYSRLLSGESAVAQYARQSEIQVKAGAEIIILEMMRDIEQTGYALEGALRSGVPVWVGFTCFTGEEGQTYLLDTDIPLKRALSNLDLSKADAVGIMHTLIEHTPQAIEILKQHWEGHTFAYPHAGHFEMPNWVFHDAITPEKFAAFGREIFRSGVDAVGGCCGITPDHIRALNQLIGD
jgi:homocysteine S-methyltransferase